MKNIRLSADDQLIGQARQVARSQHKTLNRNFREWLEVYTRRNSAVERYEALSKRLG
jgi:hypothetical protein